MTTITWDSKVTTLVRDGIIPNVLNRICLAGPPRTGKSTLPLKLFAVCYRGTCHRQQPVDDWIGGYALIDGTTKWQNGIAVRAMLEGVPLVVDEIDKHSAECASFFYAMLDDPAAVTLPTGERIHAKQGYCVFATTNQRPDSLPEPIYDRFDVILKADTLSKGLQESLGDFLKPAETVVGRNGAFNWERPASVNLFIAASKLARHGLQGDALAAALGLDGQAASDFLTAIAGV
jgi:hypothetical protein